GRVTIDEGGELRFQDIDYRVVQGTISFQNPFRNDPYIDITAESRITRTGANLGPAQEYELTVNLTGTLDRIQPTITSDPPIGELTLLTLLSGGIGTDPSTRPDSLSAAGASLLMSTLGGELGSRIVPFADTFRIEPGLLGDSSSFAATVTVEKSISEDLHMIVIYETGSTENREIIQWQVSPDWVIQFTRDSEQSGTYLINAVDARFRRRYQGHW
ncbi:MAG: translocation/assembly module TamB domain-containing protein, partial [Thermoanaerobaculia bacterium]|nr:translocation/assembly module TamB domain-containing protein [Thermoanaerobaculia bacterium]